MKISGRTRFFTLVEIMVAAGIMVFSLSSIFLFWRSASSNDRNLSDEQIYHNRYMTFMSQLRKDVNSAMDVNEIVPGKCYDIEIVDLKQETGMPFTRIVKYEVSEKGNSISRKTSEGTVINYDFGNYVAGKKIEFRIK